MVQITKQKSTKRKIRTTMHPPLKNPRSYSRKIIVLELDTGKKELKSLASILRKSSIRITPNNITQEDINAILQNYKCSEVYARNYDSRTYYHGRLEPTISDGLLTPTTYWCIESMNEKHSTPNLPYTKLKDLIVIS